MTSDPRRRAKARAKARAKDRQCPLRISVDVSVATCEPQMGCQPNNLIIIMIDMRKFGAHKCSNGMSKMIMRKSSNPDEFDHDLTS